MSNNNKYREKKAIIQLLKVAWNSLKSNVIITCATTKLERKKEKKTHFTTNYKSETRGNSQKWSPHCSYFILQL